MRKVLEEMRELKKVKKKISKFREKVRRELKKQDMSISKEMKEFRREVKKLKDREVWSQEGKEEMIGRINKLKKKIKEWKREKGRGRKRGETRE